MTLPKNESFQSIRSWYLIITDIAKILLVLGILTVIYLFFEKIIPPIDVLNCMVPKSALEMLLGVGGMIGLTALGLPFAPATVFGLATWAIIKFLMCQH